MQICVAAGEVSGDQILAPILSRVSELETSLYSGIAGPQMIEAGTYPLFPMDRLSVMGMEVLPRLPELLSIRHQDEALFVNITSDSAHYMRCPGFQFAAVCTRKTARDSGNSRCQSICLGLAQKPNSEIAKQLDLLLCMFPFEPALYDGFWPSV